MPCSSQGLYVTACGRQRASAPKTSPFGPRTSIRSASPSYCSSPSARLIWLEWALQFGNVFVSLLTSSLAIGLLWLSACVCASSTPLRPLGAPRMPPGWRSYCILWNVYRRLGQVSNVISNVLEGESGVMWTLLFLALFISFLPKESLSRGIDIGLDCCDPDGDDLGRTALGRRLALEYHSPGGSIPGYVRTHAAALAGRHGIGKKGGLDVCRDPGMTRSGLSDDASAGKTSGRADGSSACLRRRPWC